MKKSEMVNIVADFIHEHRRATEAWTSEDMAEEILAIVGSEGMLPPADHVILTNVEGKRVGESFVAMWESEDDE